MTVKLDRNTTSTTSTRSNAANANVTPDGSAPTTNANAATSATSVSDVAPTDGVDKAGAAAAPAIGAGTPALARLGAGLSDAREGRTRLVFAYTDVNNAFFPQGDPLQVTLDKQGAQASVTVGGWGPAPLAPDGSFSLHVTRAPFGGDKKDLLVRGQLRLRDGAFEGNVEAIDVTSGLRPAPRSAPWFARADYVPDTQTHVLHAVLGPAMVDGKNVTFARMTSTRQDTDNALGPPKGAVLRVQNGDIGVHIDGQNHFAGWGDDKPSFVPLSELRMLRDGSIDVGDGSRLVPDAAARKLLQEAMQKVAITPITDGAVTFGGERIELRVVDPSNPRTALLRRAGEPDFHPVATDKALNETVTEYVRPLGKSYTVAIQGPLKNVALDAAVFNELATMSARASLSDYLAKNPAVVALADVPPDLLSMNLGTASFHYDFLGRKMVADDKRDVVPPAAAAFGAYIASLPLLLDPPAPPPAKPRPPGVYIE